MDSPIFLGLINNIALLMTLGLLYDSLPLREHKRLSSLGQLLIGFVLGCMGVAVMLMPRMLEPGLIFDTRSVLLAIAGLFFGTLPTLVVMVMTIALRLAQGGSGVGVGVAIIVCSGALGVVWRHARLHKRKQISRRELYLFGVIVHLVMLLCMFLLPWPMPLEVLSKISAPVLLLHPLGVLLLGILLTQREARKQATEALRQSAAELRASEAQLRQNEVSLRQNETALRQNEMSLRKSEERWQFALEGAGDGVWDWDVAGQQIFFSRQWKNMLGYAEDEIRTVAEWQALTHPDDRPFVQAQMDGHCAGTLEFFSAEYRVKCKDDAYKWVLGRGKVVSRTPTGQPLRMIGTHADITERKQAEDERKATIDLLRLMTNTEDQHELIRTLLIYLKNWSGCQAVGIRIKDGDDYPYFEAIGFPESFIRHENYLCSYNEVGELERDVLGNPVLECMCGNVLRGRINASKPFFSAHGSFWSNCTTRLLRTTSEADRQARTRNRCNGEGYESVALIPLHVGEETIGLIQLNDKRPDRFTPERIDLFERLADNIANFLARKQIQKELRASEERFSKVFRASPVGISVTHLESGLYTDVNDAFLRIFGYERAEVIGHSSFDLHLWGCPQERIQMVELLTNQGRIQNIEAEMIGKDGSVGQALISSEMIEVGGQQYILDLTHDISERKQAEQQLRDSLREKEVLLRELYHRTKNNMQVIRSMLVLQSAEMHGEEVQRLVKETDHKIQVMALVHQMLYQSHNLDSINLQMYIHELAQLILSSYAPAAQAIHLRLDLQSVHVTIDIATPLGLILNELLSNTCKHAFPNGAAGEIFIGLHQQEMGWLEVVYSDTGQGVPPGFALREQQSYGLLSVFSLAEHQLGGQVQTGTGPAGHGLCYTIRFLDGQYQKRV